MDAPVPLHPAPEEGDICIKATNHEQAKGQSSLKNFLFDTRTCTGFGACPPQATICTAAPVSRCRAHIMFYPVVISLLREGCLLPCLPHRDKIKEALTEDWEKVRCTHEAWAHDA
jgi:hypothetical protein